MGGLGFPGFLMVMFTLCVYVLIGYVVWKFYSLLARMNQNIEGIRREIERHTGPAGPASQG
jgi:hypothetical protein